MSAFPRNLRHARKLAGLSQGELAAKIGNTQSAVSGWETGRASPGLQDLEVLCKVLGVPADWILTDHPYLGEDDDGTGSEEKPRDEVDSDLRADAPGPPD